MNSIRRSRRRPRRKSVNFRSLWWVLSHEAAMGIIYPWVFGTKHEPMVRAYVARHETAEICRRAWGHMRAMPDRRYFASEVR